MAKRKTPRTPAAGGKKATARQQGSAGGKKAARRKEIGPHPTRRVPRATKTGGPKQGKTQQAVPIVGIGGSAGGLEAFTHLLEALPPDTGMAFVVVSHLSHTHKSILTELLARITAMRVSQVTETTPVAANHVYVIPPNMNLSIVDGVIEVSPFDKERRPPMPIDFFLRSLAESRKSGAVGVLLSGTGTDGTLGLAAIKAEGGITFAQDEASARYADMPRSAAQAGAADFVLPPEQIAAELDRIACHPYVVETGVAPAAEDQTQPRDGLSQVFALIQRSSGVDFSFYKPATIKRRISRRMLLHKIESLNAYQSFLKEKPSELEALYHDLLINVTSFFRDAEEYQFLQQEILPKVVAARRRDGPIRVWIPGCASGEEVYSIVICLLETLNDFGPNPPLQVFATDVSEAAIKRARDGVYPENIAGDISPARLRRFFFRTAGGYQTIKAVRDLCVFAPQNLVKDPPFSRVDLISCRNVLIYLGTPLQRRVLSTFHYALKPNGFLVLGSSETTTAASELFEQVAKRHKVYSKLHSAARPHLDLPGAGGELGMRGSAKRHEHETQSLDVGGEADRIVLSRYSPPGVVVNPALEIVQFRGRTSRYLEPSPGEASFNLFRMARPGLVVDLRATVHQAQKRGMAARKEGVQVRVNGEVRTVNIEVAPLAGDGTTEGYLLVVFDETATQPMPLAEKIPPEPGKRGRRRATAAEKEMEALRKELAASQQDLHSIIEEQEASSEELQSSNEEILSANEELQSTNEELETAKEELQATNEELTTVNEELQNRNAELTQANNDLQNLIATSDVVMVMIGHDLRIRRITPAAQRVMNLIPADVGRPLSNIKTNLKIANLEDQITDVIDRIAPAGTEVQDEQGRWYSMRIRPYRTEDNKIDGAVMVLVDIDAVKRGEESEEVWRALVDPFPDFIVSADPEGKVLFLNRTVASLAKKVAVGENIYDFIDPSNHPSLKRCLQKVISSGKGGTFETTTSSARGGAPYHTQVNPIKSKGAVVALTLLTAKPR